MSCGFATYLLGLGFFGVFDLILGLGLAGSGLGTGSSMGGGSTYKIGATPSSVAGPSTGNGGSAGKGSVGKPTGSGSGAKSNSSKSSSSSTAFFFFFLEGALKKKRKNALLKDGFPFRGETVFYLNFTGRLILNINNGNRKFRVW